MAPVSYISCKLAQTNTHTEREKLGEVIYLWYWVWRNWNSSLMRSRVSRTVNLKDWPG